MPAELVGGPPSRCGVVGYGGSTSDRPNLTTDGHINIIVTVKIRANEC